MTSVGWAMETRMNCVMYFNSKDGILDLHLIDFYFTYIIVKIKNIPLSSLLRISEASATIGKVV
jgi:hypothetical protein